MCQIDPNSMCATYFHYPTAWQSATKSLGGYPTHAHPGGTPQEKGGAPPPLLFWGGRVILAGNRIRCPYHFRHTYYMQLYQIVFCVFFSVFRELLILAEHSFTLTAVCLKIDLADVSRLCRFLSHKDCLVANVLVVHFRILPA